jgi:hypothetical protein
MTYYDDELYHYDDELYHYGVKGMKWGVRRFRKNIGNGISRIRRKGSAFYKKHRRAINTAAGLAGAAALGYGAYRLDKATGGHGAAAIRRAGSAAKNMYNNARSIDYRTTLKDIGYQAGQRARKFGSGLSSRYYGSKFHQKVAPIKTGIRNAGHKAWRDAKIAGRKVGPAAKRFGANVGSTAKKYGSKVGSAAKNMYNNARSVNYRNVARDVGYEVGQRVGRFGRQTAFNVGRVGATAKRKTREALANLRRRRRGY